ncbi:MAG: SMP-30/gluconolactonase/LRE family protein [Nitrospiraceae bacterium]|nr:SMP-30/gluconolactonase/LRE family protein [Nitrospiraceae bacterium]
MENVAEGPSAALVEKHRKLEQAVQAAKREKKDLTPVARIVRELDPLMKERKFREAETLLDRALKAVEESKPGSDPTVRLQEKVHKIEEGARKWQEDGKDPSPIAEIMQEFDPLMKAGKIQEAEAVLDRALSVALGSAQAAAPDIPKEELKASIEKVATGFKMAEGPIWDGENFLFTDVPASTILKLGSDGKVSTIRSDTRWGAGLAFDSKRRLIICEVMGRRVTRVENNGAEKTLAESYEGKKLNGPNDLTVDARDGVYFTDPLFLNKDKRELDKEAVYYISPEGRVLRVADDMERPNGIALAGDGKTLFVADTAKSKLRAYPVKEDGTLGEGRDVGSVTGPDGVREDPDGKVYVAGRKGITVWDASGYRLGTLSTLESPSSLAFGDKDRRTMYITAKSSVYKVRIDQALKMLTTEDKEEKR